MGNIMLDLIFSAIGLGYLRIGKVKASYSFLIAGLILTTYSFFIKNLFLDLLIGIILIMCPFIVNKYL